MEKDVNYYLNLPWSYVFEWSEEDGCYLGSIVELEKNMTCGDNPQEVFNNLREALIAYINTSLSNGLTIFEPLKSSDFRGTMTYRTNPEKHYKLAKIAKISGKSINAFIDEAVDDKLKASA